MSARVFLSTQTPVRVPGLMNRLSPSRPSSCPGRPLRRSRAWNHDAIAKIIKFLKGVDGAVRIRSTADAEHVRVNANACIHTESDFPSLTHIATERRAGAPLGTTRFQISKSAKSSFGENMG